MKFVLRPSKMSATCQVGLPAGTGERQKVSIVELFSYAQMTLRHPAVPRHVSQSRAHFFRSRAFQNVRVQNLRQETLKNKHLFVCVFFNQEKLIIHRGKKNKQHIGKSNHHVENKYRSFRAGRGQRRQRSGAVSNVYNVRSGKSNITSKLFELVCLCVCEVSCFVKLCY
jgi:hypothetical protein